MPHPPQQTVSNLEFDKYRHVQYLGDYNMLDPRAQVATGLSPEVFAACQDRYEELEELYGKFHP